MKYFHSVTLDKEKCHGCTNCITHCPTEAIRVQQGKAKIIKERCIDCGECIKVCQSHAKNAAADDFSMLDNFKYNIAMPAPSFYSQFRCEMSVNRILSAFLEIGFDDVFEVSRGAEYVSAATRKLIAEGDLKMPIISSACPAVLRLIRERFANLLPNVLKILSPMETAAMLAREEARKKTGLCDEEIGVFFITPCPAKVTSIKSPLTLDKSYVSGAIPAKDAFAKIHHVIDDVTEKPLAVSGTEGIIWAKSGGECRATGVEDYISVDGIDNVISVLEEIENGKVNSVEFIELAACTSGCSGGALNIVNPFLASRRITQQSKKCGKIKVPENADLEKILWKKKVKGAPISPLDDDLSVAMEKMERMDEIYADLPKLDCGSCGAPTCRALAEDIVRGFSTENSCIFKMRDRVHELAKELFELNESSYTDRKRKK